MNPKVKGLQFPLTWAFFDPYGTGVELLTPALFVLEKIILLFWTVNFLHFVKIWLMGIDIYIYIFIIHIYQFHIVRTCPVCLGGYDVLMLCNGSHYSEWLFHHSASICLCFLECPSTNSGSVCVCLYHKSQFWTDYTWTNQTKTQNVFPAYMYGSLQKIHGAPTSATKFAHKAFTAQAIHWKGKVIAWCFPSYSLDPENDDKKPLRLLGRVCAF